MAGPALAIIGCIITIVLALSTNVDQQIKLDGVKQGLFVSKDGKDIEHARVRVGDADKAVVNVAAFANEWVPLVIQVPLEDVKPGLYDLELKAETLDSENVKLKADGKTSFYVPN